MKRLILLIVCLFVSISVHAASSPNVPIDDHVYRDIDQLVAAGLIKDAIYGQRPWSRNEIARMIAQARRRHDEKGGIASDARRMVTAIMAEYTIEQLESEYRDELAGDKSVRFHWLEEASAEAAYLDSPYRAVPESNGLGSIKAVINPLVAYREGRHYANGGTLALESVHWATSQYFSVYAQPRFEGLIPNEGSSHVDIRAQRLYGKFTLGNLEMEVGRDSLIWGSGEHGGVLASNNARNLDMVKISNDSPFVHPWIFKFLGPSKYTFFVADLGSSYAYSDAYLYGFAASFKPASFLELGIEHQITVGGKGAPEVSFGDVVREFFAFRGDLKGPNLTNHLIGINARAQIPQLRGASIYGECVFEELGKESFWLQFTQWMGFMSGFYFPLLTADGSNDLRIEYEHIPAAYGRHSMWTSGLTEDNVLRGSELGQDGHGIHVTWGHSFPSGTWWKNAVHYEYRDSDLYVQRRPYVGGPMELVHVADRPLESRFRLSTSLEWTMHKRFVIRPELGYERVWNFDFATGSNRNNFLAAVSFRYLPGFK